MRADQTEQHEHFGSGRFVGDEVIVGTAVTEVLGQNAFVLDGRYGPLRDGVHRTNSDEEFLVAQNVWHYVPASSGTTTPSR